ncbi:MAG: LamG-like jellyroll fold domain-containing protein, partial [Patescibacteria group bacterium]|nr:LamG-like jellyroll fold domain-containing protein [Patescibacteria group bacterium]
MENWCTQKWKNDKSNRFHKTKEHKISGSRYKEKEHIFIFFGMCLAAILLFASIGVAGATNYMPQDCYSFTLESAPEPDIVADWHLDAGSGLTAVDSSGNGNDGTLVNNPAWVDGKMSKALQFDGINDYVDCGNDESLSPATITIEAWVKPATSGVTYNIVRKRDWSTYYYDYCLVKDGDKLEFQAGNGLTRLKIQTDSLNWDSNGNTWYHIAATYDGVTTRIYRDGVTVKEDTKGIGPIVRGTSYNLLIGKSPVHSSDLFHGLIDEVKIYNGALNAEEIRELYEANPTNRPPVADPKGPYTGTEEVPILFTGSGSYDPDGSIVAYEWDFGDGDTATGVAPTHTYVQNGTYTVTLTVTDNEGTSNTSTTTAT